MTNHTYDLKEEERERVWSELTRLLGGRDMTSHQAGQEVGRILINKVIGRQTRPVLFGLFKEKGNSNLFTLDQLTDRLRARGVEATSQEVLFGLGYSSAYFPLAQRWYLEEKHQLHDGSQVYQFVDCSA
ncbi:hypothetical protein J4455_00895 [Candidatus Woesearchaeota archaeon]|nr:hypothetical protein [Candidatus Woesearchaeota archaeon]